MAMMISWVAPVNPSHPYLENDPAPSFDRNICAFHLGFSLVKLEAYLREGINRVASADSKVTLADAVIRLRERIEHEAKTGLIEHSSDGAAWVTEEQGRRMWGATWLGSQSGTGAD